ncbi:MAG: N-(5'-phosphoribosyl)anthranilate isomerase [Phycisphaerae bacterium]|nr:N-(5'-phosphoribosyl)anthranilate isomerase [Phycisphaerae bacterium]
MNRTRIKVCGVQDVETARAAADCGADAVGLVFVEGSPRLVDPEVGREIVSKLPPFMISVAVVRDLDLDAFSEVEEACPCAYAQMHGDEDEPTVAACGPYAIKAIAFDPATIVAELRRWSRLAEVDAVLIDGPRAGSGETIDWTSLAAAQKEVAVPKPLILAGGLNAANVAEAIDVVKPYAVDVSSGVESQRGVKDPDLIAAFCDAVRLADAR